MSLPRRHALAIAGLSLIALGLSTSMPATAASGHAAPGLTGTWQVKRACIAGCAGVTTSTETVVQHDKNVYMATGTTDMALYLIGKQVLVHSKTATTLLTIKTPGQLMSGSGIADDGSTFTSTWTCTAKATAQNLTGARLAGAAAERSGSAPHGRPIC